MFHPRTGPPLLPVAITLGVLACDPAKPDDTAGAGTDTGTPSDWSIPPCEGNGWGFITSPELAIHVRRNAPVGGDGSLVSPFSTLEAALAASRARETDKIIAIGPGTYETNVALTNDPGDDSTDNGTILQGCSAAETVLLAQETDSATVLLSGVQGVLMEGLSIHGGLPGIKAWSGATGTVRSIRVEDASAAGVAVLGNTTNLALVDMEVHDPVPPTGGSTGFGFAISEGATVSLSGGGAWNAVGAALFIDDATQVSVTGATFEGTQANTNGLYGRGIHIQNYTSQVTIADTVLRDNHDAGIFALATAALSVTGCTVVNTLEGALPDAETTSGDGIVVSRGPGNLNPADFEATLDGNTVYSAARAGVIIDGVTATVSGNTVSGCGFNQEGTSIVSQGPASVAGTDNVAGLADDAALDLNLEAM